MLKFHEAGVEHEKVVVLIHGWGCPWQIWDFYINELQKSYHVIIPSLAGYNDDGQFGQGIDYNAREITHHVQQRFSSIHAMVGVSYGANVTLKILALNKIPIAHAIADACYLPEKTVTKQAKFMRFCACIYSFARPFRKLLIQTNAKIWGLENSTRIVDKILSLPQQTLRDEIYSYFTFSLPDNTETISTNLYLWYGEKEKAKLRNSSHIQKRFPGARVEVFEGCNHGQFILGKQKECLEYIRSIID